MIGSAARAFRVRLAAFPLVLVPPSVSNFATFTTTSSPPPSSPKTATVSESLEEAKKEERRGVFYSLKRASAKSKEVVELNLSASDDLTCLNVMCSKLGEPCLCRASVVLGKFKNLEKLDISRNRLTALPESLDQLERLKSLNIANNPLEGNLPKEVGKLLLNREGEGEGEGEGEAKVELEMVLDPWLWEKHEDQWIKLKSKQEEEENKHISFRIVSE